jgi:hypothetical protein
MIPALGKEAYRGLSCIETGIPKPLKRGALNDRLWPIPEMTAAVQRGRFLE